MSEESKPIAPGGASPVCEICGRGDRGMDGCPRTDPDSRYWRFTAECYQHGYQRERRRAESAERELESCRSRLSTAEKERDAYKRVAEIRSALLEGDDKPFREEIAAAEKERDEADMRVKALLRAPPAGLEALELVRAWWRTEGREEDFPIGAVDAVLYGSDTTDAPTAPKASEIASDSSALEKALGALRDLRQQVEDTIMVAQKDEDADGWITAYHFKTGAIHRLLAKARDTSAGGAHVDVPKATPEPDLSCANCRCLRSGHHAGGCEGAGGNCGCNGYRYPAVDVPKAQKEEET